MSFWDEVSKAIGTDSSNGAIGKIGKELTNNPIVNAALVAAGSIYGGPAGAAAVNGTISRAQGNDWGQVASNAAGAALGSYAAGAYNPALSGGGSLSGAGAAINPFSGGAAGGAGNVSYSAGNVIAAGPGVASSGAMMGGAAGASWIPGVSNGTALAMGGNLISGLVGAKAARDASDAQGEAAARADATQRYMYDQTREDNAPFRQTGLQANSRLAELMNGGQFERRFAQSDLEADPVYQNGLKFGLDQGTQGINRQAAAGGSFLSGATLKALTRFGNDYGSQKANDSYNRFNTDMTNQYNRYAGLSGAGQQATNQVSAAGQNMANNVSQNQLQAGNARASGYMGQANAISGAINGGLNYMQQQNIIDAYGRKNGIGGP